MHILCNPPPPPYAYLSWQLRLPPANNKVETEAMTTAPLQARSITPSGAPQLVTYNEGLLMWPCARGDKATRQPPQSPPRASHLTVHTVHSTQRKGVSPILQRWPLRPRVGW